jgi:hypothetical protein
MESTQLPAHILKTVPSLPSGKVVASKGEIIVVSRCIGGDCRPLS